MLYWDAKEDEIDLDLIEKIQRRVDVAENAERLFEGSFRPVRSYFARLGFPPQVCDDLTLEVFAKVYQGLESFQRRSSFRTRLMTIATQVYRNEVRKRRGDPHEAPEKPLTGAPVLAGTAELPASIETLPPTTRRVFLLHKRDGYAPQEIAVLLKITADSVESHLKLVRELDEKGRTL
jgi:RNA polymerase sigma-70 factor (ECF subfamily)